MKRFMFFLVSILLPLAAGAQVLEINAPATVAQGRTFNVEYRIDLPPGQFDVPDFGGLSVVAGPAVSSQSSSVAANGQVKTRQTTYYTFMLVGRQAGVYTLPAATVTVDGKRYTSRPSPVEVVEQREDLQQKSAARTGDDIFLRAVPDRTTVWKGEPVRVIFKLYSRNRNIQSEGVKAPAMNGFWSESLNVEQYEPQTESYRSAVYHTWVVGEHLLFPLQSGSLHVGTMQMNLIVREVGRGAPTIEEMLMGEASVVETRRTVTSPEVKITVRDLPGGAPAGFGGAVGAFTMSAEPPRGELRANAGAAYRIRIAGTGNFPQISAPTVELPASFEALNTKSIDETRPSGRGMTGSKQFEYPFVARGEGSYRLQPVAFSYFDPQKGVYQTLTAPEVRVDVLADTLGGVAQGVVTGVAQRELEILNRDIRFIKHDEPGLRLRGGIFIFSSGYFVAVGLLVAIFGVLLIYLRKQLRLRRNEDIMRGRRAHKVVHARLRTADDHLREGNSRRFHDEMLKALWGYMGDKLNIPAANLTKENVRERLHQRQVPNELIIRYMGLISECESAQYSLGESAPPADVYAAVADTISKIERYFK